MKKNVLNIIKVAPNTAVVDTASHLAVNDPSITKGERVLVVEDGPTLTYSEIKIGSAELIDPRPFTVGKLSETFEIYPNIGKLIPAMVHNVQQLKSLEISINKTDYDTVVIGTAIDLQETVKTEKTSTKVHYDLQEISQADLVDVIDDFVKKNNL